MNSWKSVSLLSLNRIFKGLVHHLMLPRSSDNCIYECDITNTIPEWILFKMSTAMKTFYILSRQSLGTEMNEITSFHFKKKK